MIKLAFVAIVGALAIIAFRTLCTKMLKSERRSNYERGYRCGVQKIKEKEVEFVEQWLLNHANGDDFDRGVAASLFDHHYGHRDTSPSDVVSNKGDLNG